jgi:hemerythrin
MSLITWSEKLSIGVPSIDDQHKKLVTLINQLHDGMLAGRGKEVLGDVLKGLADYTRTHFKYEEDVFAKTGYPDAVAHKKEHTELLQRVIEIQQKYNVSGPGALTIQVMNFLKDWLTKHIQGSDMRYTQHFKEKGIR